MFFTSVHSPRSAQSAHSHMVKSLVLIRHPKKWLENVTANDETASSRTFSSIAIFFAEVLLLVVMLGMGEKSSKRLPPKKLDGWSEKKTLLIQRGPTGSADPSQLVLGQPGPWFGRSD